MSTELDFAKIFDLGLSIVPILALVTLALMFSAYVKLVTVLSILRAGLGVFSLPSAFVTGSLALSLTFFIMYPTISSSISEINKSIEVKKIEKGKKGLSDKDKVLAVYSGIKVWKRFISKHSSLEEKEKFAKLAIEIDKNGLSEAKDYSDIKESFRVLAPSFIVTELKEAFSTGLSLFLPFLVIEIVIASILMSMGFNQLSPHIVSFPFKIMLFVLLDGWGMITGNLVSTYS